MFMKERVKGREIDSPQINFIGPDKQFFLA